MRTLYFCLILLALATTASANDSTHLVIVAPKGTAAEPFKAKESELLRVEWQDLRENGKGPYKLEVKNIGTKEFKTVKVEGLNSTLTLAPGDYSLKVSAESFFSSSQLVKVTPDDGRIFGPFLLVLGLFVLVGLMLRLIMN